MPAGGGVRAAPSRWMGEGAVQQGGGACGRMLDARSCGGGGSGWAHLRADCNAGPPSHTPTSQQIVRLQHHLRQEVAIQARQVVALICNSGSSQQAAQVKREGHGGNHTSRGRRRRVNERRRPQTHAASWWTCAECGHACHAGHLRAPREAQGPAATAGSAGSGWFRSRGSPLAPAWPCYKCTVPYLLCCLGCHQPWRGTERS